MICFQDVYFSYIQSNVILQNVNLKINPGLTLILGPNGCGKSTLLKIMAGIERPDRGYIEIGGFDLWKDEVAARRELAFVPEQPDLTPYASVRDVIALVCRLRRQSSARCAEVIRKVALEDVSHRTIRELSMGQRRRVTLAAAWISTPKVVLLDEPLEAMDRIIRKDILSWIDDLIARDATVVIVTHEIEPFAAKTSHTVTIRDGDCTMHDLQPLNGAERLELINGFSRGL